MQSNLSQDPPHDSKKDRWLQEQDKDDFLTVLDNARRGIRAGIAFLKAAEGPHDSPFSDECEELWGLEQKLRDMEDRVNQYEIHVPSF